MTDRSPAQKRYDEKRPTRTFRSTPEIEQWLDEMQDRTDHSVSEILRHAVIGSMNEYERGHRVGWEEGISCFPVRCSNCEEPEIVDLQENPEAFRTILRVMGYILDVACPDCGGGIKLVDDLAEHLKLAAVGEGADVEILLPPEARKIRS